MKVMKQIEKMKEELLQTGKTENIFSAQDVEKFFESLTFDNFRIARNKEHLLKEMLAFQIKNIFNTIGEKASKRFETILRKTNKSDKKVELLRKHQDPTTNVDEFFSHHPFDETIIDGELFVCDYLVGDREIIFNSKICPRRNFVTEFFDFNGRQDMSNNVLIHFLKLLKTNIEEFSNYVKYQITKELNSFLNYCKKLEKETVTKWNNTLFAKYNDAFLDLQIVPQIEFDDERKDNIHLVKLKFPSYQIKCIGKVNVEGEGLFHKIFDEPKTDVSTLHYVQKHWMTRPEDVFNDLRRKFAADILKVAKDIAKNKLPREMTENLNFMMFNLDLNDSIAVHFFEHDEFGAKILEATEEDIVTFFKKAFISREIVDAFVRKRKDREFSFRTLNEFSIVDEPIENGYNTEKRLISTYISLFQLSQFADDMLE